MTQPPIHPHKRVQLQFEVSSQNEADELNAAWHEILSGNRTRLSAAAEDLTNIMDRAMLALETIVKAIEEHPGTGQTRRLTRFLAGMYNGNDFPFDLTDLRTLDTDLANACIDYLNYDRLGKVEVHTHLPDRGRQMQWFIAQHQVRPQLHLSRDDAHESRLFALAGHLDKDVDSLAKEALEELLSRYETKSFGSLLATQPSPDGDRPLIHARHLSEPEPRPLCGTNDGPWTTRVFEFTRLTCHDCQSHVLHPEASPA